MGRDRKITTGVIVFVVLIAVVIAYSFFKGGSKVSTGDNGEIFCATDVKECSDGTFVSRVPPSCDFRACPASTSTSTTTKTNQ